MNAAEAREQADNVHLNDRYIGIINAVDVASDEGAVGIVVDELTEDVIERLNVEGYRTLTSYGHTTILW